MTESTAYLFPGQGSQVVGMGRALAEAFAVARDAFAEADDILGFALSKLCFEGPAEVLTETTNAQPAILVASVAALRSLAFAQPDLPPPCCVAGHSLGEYSALVAAGALSFADAIRLTRARGELMAQAGARNPGSMAAILKLDDGQVAAICEEAAAKTGDVVQVANYNAPGQVVISGGSRGVAAASELARVAGGRPRPLAVSIAAHSSLMATASQGLADALARTQFSTTQVPVIGNTQARPLTTEADMRAELVAQLTSSVRWTDSMRAMSMMGATRFLELGPGDVLTGLIRRILPEPTAANVRTPEDIGALSAMG